jgi:hypothetical protein
VYCIWILSNKLDLNQETSFYYNINILLIDLWRSNKPTCSLNSSLSVSASWDERAISSGSIPSFAVPEFFKFVLSTISDFRASLSRQLLVQKMKRCYDSYRFKFYLMGMSQPINSFVVSRNCWLISLSKIWLLINLLNSASKILIYEDS